MIVEESLNRLKDCQYNKLDLLSEIYLNATLKLRYSDGARPVLRSSRSCWVR